MIRDVLLFGTTTLKRVVRDRRWDLGVMVLAAAGYLAAGIVIAR